MRRKILNVGSDPQLVAAHSAVLTSAGFEVIGATNLLQVIRPCEQHDFALVVLGHRLNVNEKGRITSTVRSGCKRGTPVLALYQTSVSEADDADAALPAEDGPEALVKAVEKMLRSGVRNLKKAKAARKGH